MSLRSHQSEEAGSVESGGGAGGDESSSRSSSPLVGLVWTAAIYLDKEVTKERSTVMATTTMTTTSAPDGDAVETERDHQNSPPFLSPDTVKKERPRSKENLEPLGRRQQGIAVWTAAVSESLPPPPLSPLSG